MRCSFVWRTCGHRALHSCPTRRSSDLWRGRRGGDGGGEGGPWRGEVYLHRACPQRSLRKPQRELRTGPVQVYFPAPWPDRKSTRLNSSHLGSSYAVFSFKKKMDEEHGN